MAPSPRSLKPAPPPPQPSSPPTPSSPSPSPSPSSSPEETLKSPSLYSDIFYDASHHLHATPSSQTIDSLAPIETFFRKNPRFLYSAAALKDHPYNPLTPEVVLLGASNVGKSSFLNALVSRSGTARVGPRPGKTTLMNAYGVGPAPITPKKDLTPGTHKPTHPLIVMDTPGYGFKSKATWGKSIVEYLASRKALRGAIVLLSSEKKLLDTDRWILKTLADTNTRTLAVLTKVDKAKGRWSVVGSDMARALQEELRALEVQSDYEWSEGSGWVPDVYLTAAGMRGASNTLGNGGGMGGVRAAILEMAGIDLGVKRAKTPEEPQNKSYEGKIVSFDDLQWKK
ncbi:hypothetical protein VHEMI10144 [[Torrubiella] hemipterigena]|uniref:EngB-type G domain-containing protein n=1 Tax=[Torrubiella] hemipterigena TaxID=1531966 RepID=A0A0A1TRD1_9HYPO|nr:hypothetical protein VHEMI10144 [[Torrubiella] hemipterigena]